MNDFAPAQKLRDHRPLLLALEAVGWLHMAGKARSEFLREQSGQASGYDDRRWHENESPPFPWHDLLDWAKTRFAKVNGVDVGWPGTLTDFLTKHRDTGGSGLLGLLQAGHAMASGIEKNLPKATSAYLGQDATHLWLSSAFGQPVRNLLLHPPEILSAAGWRRLVAEIRRVLEELKSLGTAGTTDVEGWRLWRESAIGPASLLRRAFSSTVAETRLPNNDVTLWDQSYVAAALFKSGVAGAVLEESAFPWADGTVKQNTRWRLLTVGIGADHYEARAVRIGDWTGARLALDDFFGRVRTLIEVELGLGSLLYRDGSVQVFSFPAERSNGGRATGLDVGTWQTWLQGEIDSIAADLCLETPPHSQISEATRSLVPMTSEIQDAKARVAVPVHRVWDVTNSRGNGHVCPVCLVRHNGRSNEKQQPCKPCRDRRTHRLDAWLQNQLGGDTIWITELADANDRVAIITLNLDIEPWLDGTRLDSLRTQAVPEWRKNNPTLGSNANPTGRDEPFASLVAYVKGKLGEYDKQDPVLRRLQDGYQYEPDWPTFFAKVVEDRSKAPSWDGLADDGRARWLVHQLLRKLASPGRVHRFWRQAEEFFTQILGEFREIASRDQNRWRVRRLVLEPDGSSRAVGWQDREVYAGRWSGRPSAPIDLLYRADLGGFVTAANLARLLRAHESGGMLQSGEFTLRDDAGHEHTLRIGRVRDNVADLGVYYPVIPLDLSPVRFRVLLPLDAASACLDRAIELWNEQFARIWDRLPLRAGIVAFPRMTPFQAVIEATRNIEGELEEAASERWRLTGRDDRNGVVALHLKRPESSGGAELRTVPVEMADGRTDVFYPYLAVEDRESRFPHDFQHPDGQIYRHALDLRLGDGIEISPARLGTLFLESTAQRFDELSIRPLLEWHRMRDTWHLIHRAAPSLSALRSVWSDLCERQESWKTPSGEWLGDGKRVWFDLTRAILKDRLSLDGAALDTLAQAAEDGVLEWALEWHLSVLKERLPEVAYA